MLRTFYRIPVAKLRQFDAIDSESIHLPYIIFRYKSWIRFT